jgi:uncharacterized membrane protein YoaK (UPF0700 family)
MLTRLPGWVWAGAWGLAFAAGIVNVVGLLGFQHQAITHLTGNSSLLAVALVQGDAKALASLAALMGSFVLGATLSGLIIQDATLRLGRRYGVALGCGAVLLVVGARLLASGNALGLYAAACACGLQNAMASTYSGSVIRTTHVSGMFTDLGIAVGHAVRGIPVERRRLQLCGTVISGFIAGGALGAFAFQRLGYDALLVPAAISAGAAGLYGLYRIRQAR